MRLKLSALLTALALVVGTGVAQASNIALRVSDGTTTVTILDNSVVPLDTNPVTGAIVWSGAFASGWNVTVGVGVGESQLGIPGAMDLTYTAISSTGASSTLTFWLTQTDMSPSYPGWALHIGSTPVNADVVYRAFADDGNGAFVEGAQIGSTLGASGSSSGSASVVPLYSLTQRIDVSAVVRGQAANSTGDANLIPLPEPSSLLLLGTGLLALGGYARRRYLGQ